MTDSQNTPNGANGEDYIDLDQDDEIPNEGKDDKSKGKPKDETPEQRSKRLERIKDRHDKKHGLGKYATQPDKDKDTPTKKDQPKGLDRGDKAYLIALGYTDREEHDIAFKIAQETGKELEDVIEGKYFKSEIEEYRDDKKAKAALPKGKDRAGSDSPMSAEYWLKKGDLPPNTPENRKLRQDVVKLKRQSGTSGSNFTQNPVVK